MKTTSLWTEATRAHVARHAAAVSLLALAACGGGGGGAGPGPGGGSPPPPPPPVANAAPNAVVTVTNTAPQEGQPFTLDGSTSSDTDNDPLTFRWRQTAGPAATIPDATLAKLENLRAPEVTEDKVGTFELSVSDGKTTSKKSVNVTFTNIYQTPRFAAAPALEATLPVNGTITKKMIRFDLEDKTYFGVAATPTSGVNILELTGGFDGIPFALPSTPLTLNTFGAQTIFKQDITNVPYKNFVADESANWFRVYGKDNPDDASPFLQVAEYQLDAPCAITQQYQTGRPVVGTRGGGFQVLERAGPINGPLSYDMVQTVSDQQSFCALAEVSGPITGGFAFNGPPANPLYDMMAYDPDTNSVTVFYGTGGMDVDTARYQPRQTRAVQLETTQDLRFVKAVPTRQDGAEIGLTLLFTDDQHVGTHRMVIIGENADHEIVQQTIGWTVGVPTDAVAFYRQTTPSDIPSIAVITSDSPEAMVFTPYFVTHPEDSYLPMSGPEYFEIGLGATLAEVERRPDMVLGDTFHLVIMDSESQEARIYGPLANN